MRSRAIFFRCASLSRSSASWRFAHRLHSARNLAAKKPMQAAAAASSSVPTVCSRRASPASEKTAAQVPKPTAPTAENATSRLSPMVFASLPMEAPFSLGGILHGKEVARHGRWHGLGTDADVRRGARLRPGHAAVRWKRGQRAARAACTPFAGGPRTSSAAHKGAGKSEAWPRPRVRPAPPLPGTLKTAQSATWRCPDDARGLAGR